MKNNTFGGYSSISAFVKAKLETLDAMERSYTSLFAVMFSERENIMYEKTNGYRIEKTSYGEACDRISQRAFALSSLLKDAPRNAVIGLYMQNSLEWIELFWAILHSGFCPLLMNSRLDDRTLEEALRSSGAVAVISDGKQFSVPVFSPETILGSTASTQKEFGNAVLVMSSGTSSHVKLCSYTAEEFFHLINDTYGIIRKCAQVKKHYEGQLKLLTFLPFYHVFGLIAVYIWFGFFSRTFVHLPDMAPQTILGTIRRHKVTHIFAVPLFWEKIYDEALRTIRGRGDETFARFQKGMRIASKLGDVPVLGKLFSRLAFREVRENLFGESISFMITGGSGIKKQALAFFNAIGYPLANGYGMTEVGITSVELSNTYSMRTAGFVGRPLSSVEYKLSETGELLVRGKSLAAAISEGGTTRSRSADWFHTGDMAECVNGHYRILGRRDDLIIGPSGENLNPNLIEPKFDVSDVRDVCLIKGSSGEAVLLASVGRHLSSAALTRIKADLRETVNQLGLSGQIHKIVVVENELMEAQEFKLNRSRLARDYSAGRLKEALPAAAGETGPKDAILLRIFELFAIALEKNPEEITEETDFFLDGGGSSLDYFVLLSALREEYNVEVSSVDGASLSTPKSLYHFIRGGE